MIIRDKQLLTVWAFSILAVIYLSLQPGTDVPTPFLHSDKVGHFIAYGWLGLLPCLAFSGRNHRIASAGAMIGLGAVLELCQSLVPMRMASPGDIAANTLGVFIGVSLTYAIRKRRKVA